MAQQLRSGVAALVLVLLGGGPAPAFDCAEAGTPVETAICADPAAKASDDAMDTAFTALRAGLAGSQKQAALEDQRDWLKQRNATCAKDAKPAACIATANGARTDMLTARPQSGPGLKSRLVPVFVRQAGSRERVAVAVQLYKFADPSNPGERLLNAQADETLRKIPFRKSEPEDRDWNREESWVIAYASPTFLSVWSTGYEYSGGAHGGASGRGIHIDLRTGRLLTFSDLFDAKARAEIDASCLKQVKAEKVERGAVDGPEDPDLAKTVSAVVGSLANWSFRAKFASVYFGQYSVGSYAEGIYGCDLPIADLGKLSKMPLPPR